MAATNPLGTHEASSLLTRTKFNCENWNEVFTEKRHLTRHQNNRLHRFMCPAEKCEHQLNGLGTAHNMLLHLERIHHLSLPDIALRCEHPGCKTVFTQQWELKKHEDAKSCRFKCPVATSEYHLRCFCNSHGLRVHINRKHKSYRVSPGRMELESGYLNCHTVLGSGDLDKNHETPTYRSKCTVETCKRHLGGFAYERDMNKHHFDNKHNSGRTFRYCKQSSPKNIKKPRCAAYGKGAWLEKGKVTSRRCDCYFTHD